MLLLLITFEVVIVSSINLHVLMQIERVYELKAEKQLLYLVISKLLLLFIYIATLPFFSTGELQVVFFPPGAVLRSKKGVKRK